jgi:alpha,alpha-trehalose phosphorylase
MDLDDIGGNVKNGCHIASMGGTWMVFAYGFGGLRDYDGVLSFCPRRAPEMTGLLRFPLTYRGQVLETLREGESLVIHHEAEEVRLTRDQPKALRQVRQW